MFILTLIEDDVKVHPSDFRNEIKTIEEAIEKKYCGKVWSLITKKTKKYITKINSTLLHLKSKINIRIIKYMLYLCE